MLQIKLPKGKVSQACERAADMVTRRLVVANDRYHSELERWRKDGGMNHRTDWASPPARPNDVELLSRDRDCLHQMADMSKHSTGDVYVSSELWNLIKGVY